MIKLILCRTVMAVSVLSIGLFAGFTQIFAFSIAPGMRTLTFGTFIEIFRYDREAFDAHVLTIYLIMFISTGTWLAIWRHRYRMVEFYFVVGAFLCIFQEFILSYQGHYKINRVLEMYAHTQVVGSEWRSLRDEWAYFMFVHFTTNFIAFILILAALFRVTTATHPAQSQLA